MKLHVPSSVLAGACAVAGAVGCGGSQPPTAEPAPGAEIAPPTAAPDAAPPPRALTLTVDGKPVPITSVMATPDGDDVDIQLTNSPYSCEEWVAGYREKSYDDEITIGLILHKNLAPDGSYGWAIRGTAFQTTTSSAQDGGDPVPGAVLDPSAGAHSRLDLNLDLETMDDPPRVAHLEGPVDAIGCGPLTWMGTSEEKPPAVLPGVTLKIAGQEVPVGGAALVIGDQGRQLMLASTPVECVEGSGSVSRDYFLATHGSDVELTLTWYKDATDVDRAELGGEMMGKGGSATGGDAVRLTAAPTTAGKGAKSVTIDVGGTARIDPYSVELSGQVKAKVCR